ncbi:molybdopterin-dependent oxidoreductase [Teichococcus vastitatis]|jgi:hypothetical protein|uniref:Oxidoreductase n=1 Tax=Teichococcus vastitatis TaxID=2307076 RepID=A0ABS9W190_9PROT|nr:molybdopterin-dependent oxidoreductase [Pseudoroseomonas vastitatis]MCI0753061.1 oxidoreductase [Pseudoroseomonas vastitatis]
MLFTKRNLGLYTAKAALAGVVARPATAAVLAAPTQKPILTISGKINVRNKGETAQFDRAMLESLGMTSFETTTPWYQGTARFDGVRMDRLMETVGAFGERVLAYALNDYSTELPISDFRKYNVLLALKRDGAYMPVRDKGPLFIIYPFDSDPELKHQRFYSRSAWQLARLTVS